MTLRFQNLFFQRKTITGYGSTDEIPSSVRYFHSFFSLSIDVNSSIKPVATLSQEKNLPSNLYITKFLALSYKRLLAACTSPGVCVGVAAFNSASGTSWV